MTDENQKWYVVHVNSGHEAKVAETLKQRVQAMGLEDKITEVLIPTQDKVTVSRGKRKTIKERLFPGYVLIKMNLDDLSWYAVRSTSGVTSFVGTGGRPTPLPETEIASLMEFVKMGAPKFEVRFKPGDSVNIIDGPFADFLGQIQEVNSEKGRVKVLVSVFGRETPMDLDFVQVAPI